MDQIAILSRDSLAFPPLHHALRNPDGLLAAGGDLSVERLEQAYAHGIFPWYEDGQPILWWSPDPRYVIFPGSFRISRSLRKELRQNRFEVTLDTDFEGVIRACSRPRANADGTWITEDMIRAYVALHHAGLAHSVECYRDGRLAGGLYGVGMGRLFFGESMFHSQTNASKVAFSFLVRMLAASGCPLIDCQVGNPHLESLGAEPITRQDFAGYLQRRDGEIDWSSLPTRLSPW
ncbi:MAG: leucyl/phenylalanyl-tRNA--protein transferase [Proteobacteria bacterium]|jgi:leucyl/phenylalanyl-tRNA--protein transferase|nr:leucyl/phenylalanyl-tRNA--protein transferase [Pseudomonadota bacterium]MDA1302347.1 leucyl/phenylalanyl-tRNA--protein transferase [Pseudomonadota bacterium]